MIFYIEIGLNSKLIATIGAITYANVLFLFVYLAIVMAEAKATCGI